LALILCLIALSQSAPTPDQDSSSESNEHHHNETAPEGKVDKVIVDSAPAGARAFGSSDSPTVVACNGRCEKKWRTDQGLSGSTGQNWNLNKFCQGHDAFRTCLNTCGTSEDKTKWVKRTDKDQWICHDSTYKQNAACLENVFKETKATCDSNTKCGKYEHDDGSLKDMVKQLCLSMKCKQDCQGPTIVSKCGAAAKNDVVGVSRKTAEYLKWRVVTSAGRPNDYPVECNQLTRV